MAVRSPLLDLPGELRNKVYEEYAASTPIKSHKEVALPPPLARVCRQIRKELRSIFHVWMFPDAPIEAKVVDWDFTELLAFLRKLKSLNTGSTRELCITIDVVTPGGNYSLQRLEWLLNTRLALGWYQEDLYRYIKLEEDLFAPLRLKIAEQFFDVRHVIRFPSSDFSILQRMPSSTWDAYFLRTHCRGQGIRLHKVNNKLEDLLIISSAHAEARTEWVQNYWNKNAAWLAKLERIQRNERARIARERWVQSYWNKYAMWLGRLAEIRQRALEGR